MFGMDTMSSAVKPLADVPEFTNILLMFSNPVLGVVAGAVLTAVIQSSSASIGILQALCVTGSVTYGAALPIIMGQNIGTCVTAMISGIGASKNARRAALVHLYFNIIGTVIFMVCVLCTECRHWLCVPGRCRQSCRHRCNSQHFQHICNGCPAAIFKRSRETGLPHDQGGRGDRASRRGDGGSSVSGCQVLGSAGICDRTVQDGCHSYG